MDRFLARIRAGRAQAPMSPESAQINNHQESPAPERNEKG
jgi:hypothetical protein